MYASPPLMEAFPAAPWTEPGPRLVWGHLGEEDRNRQTRREVDARPLLSGQPGLSPFSLTSVSVTISPSFTFKYLGFHCDIVFLGVCICCFITRGLRSPSPRRLLPLMPELGQRFKGAGCMPTLAFQIIGGPLIITFNKHQVGMPSA